MPMKMTIIAISNIITSTHYIRMKKFLFIPVFLFAFSLCVSAQGLYGNQREMSPEDIAGRTTEWMDNELNLSEEQIVLVDSINLIFAKAQQVIVLAAEGDREKIRDTMTALQEEKVKSLAKVLTEDQLNLYKKKIAEMIEKRRRR
jgi:hypothetical protein